MDRFGVIFDMDGVIVDNHIYHRKSWREFAERHGRSLTDEEYNQHMNGRTVTDVVKYVFGEEMPADKVKQYSDEKEELYREMYRPHLKPVPGLEAFLTLLRENNIPAAVATSAPTANVEFTLDSLNLRHYFSRILDETAVSKGKPDPEIYQKTAAAIDMEPARCVVFEDALAGIESARRSGAAVVALSTTQSADELGHADKIIPDFKGVTVDFVKNIVENNFTRTGNESGML